MFIFLIYYLVLRWVDVSNSNVAMKFTQHYFSSQIVGGEKRYYVPPFPNVGRDMSPISLLNSVPA